MLGINELLNLAEEAIKAFEKIKLDGYAVVVTSKLSRQVRFAANKISVTKTWDETNFSILVEKDKRISAFSVGYASRNLIPKMAQLAIEAIMKAPPREDYAPLPEPADKYPSIPAEMDKTLLDQPEKLLDLAKNAIDTGLQEGAKKIAGTILAEAYNFVLVTSAGFRDGNSLSNVYLDVRAFMAKEATGHASIASRTVSGINAKEVASIAAHDAKLSENSKTIEPGKYNTVFTIDATASLMNLVGGATSAYAVDAGFSFFIKKLGTQVGPENLNVEDNPLDSNGYRIRNFDDEGVPTKRLRIIENGVLKTYLHNRFTAKKFNAEHTGHAGWVFPHAWELTVYPGDVAWEELLEMIGRGLIVSNATYIRFQNYIEGTFSAIIRDGVFYVENGEIKHAVKGLRLSDSMPRILQNIIALGKDRRQVFHWWLEEGIPVITPPMAVKEVGFTKAFA